LDLLDRRSDGPYPSCMDGHPCVTVTCGRGVSPSLVRSVERAAARAVASLHGIGLTDSVLVKIRPLKCRTWLGQYRSGTQYRGGRPIFLVSSRLEEIVEEHRREDPGSRATVELVAYDTILHEFGHVVAEGLRRLRGYGMAPDDEEEFAEDFARDIPSFYPRMEKLVTIYREDTFREGEQPRQSWFAFPRDPVREEDL